MPTAIAALQPRMIRLSEEPGTSTWLRRLSKSLAALCDPYRPELHYMRGPGPKWRAKRGMSA